MICFKNFSLMVIFLCLCTLHGRKVERDSNGVHIEIDPLPIPKEKFHGHSEVFPKLKRSFADEIDGSVNPRSAAARYLPQGFFENKGKCDIGVIREMHMRCQCHTPRKKCVRIDNPHGTVLTTMPECVIVERCEGICPYSTNCVPREKKTINVEILVTSLVPDKEDSMKVSTECTTIPVEKHMKCGCACELSEKDCSPNQVFRPDLCQCQCPNPSQAEECKNENKEWDSLACECSCPSNISQECSTGAFFHKRLCRCVPAKTEKAFRRRRL